MEKSGLKITAVVVAGLMGAVWMAGFDDLPGAVRKQIASERSALTAAQKQVAGAKEEVARGVAGERELFAALPSAALYHDRLARSESALATAARDMEQLARIEKANQRTDAEQAKQLLSRERTTYTAAVTEAEAVRKDAAHWIELKQHLPEEVREMERDYQAVQAADLTAVAAVVTKAENDWPEKRADLANRLDNLRSLQAGAEEAWQKSAAARQAAAANDTAKVDYAVLFAAGDTLHTAASGVPQKSAELKSLTGQLYTSWDKLLVDMRAERGTYEQKLRTVSTREGVSSSDERWVTVGKPVYQAMERNLGMAVEHKSTGKYDQEAERVAQPAGFAYMAPPGQSNQYGHWEHSGGRDFWVFYGQYALMRDLLFNRDYRPLDRREYDDYRTYRQRDQTYYGRDTATGSAPKYGTSGTATQERYSGSTFSKSGGFKDSKYATQKGNYRDSEYATPAMRNGGNSSGRTFGNGPSRPSSPSYRPTPSRPSMPRSPGRTFGSPRRR